MKSIIDIQEYTYNLPPDRIALHPLPERDQSKLLVYKEGAIQHTIFKTISDYLPDNSLLIFNDTKVIPARLLFTKDTGAHIEIFLLDPVKPSSVMAEVMASKGQSTWHCTIGNVKKWKDDQILIKEIGGIKLQARMINRDESLVELKWDTDHTFAEVVTLSGITPLPPYIKRETTTEDVNRYQTIYSHFEGAVAAPTAGLHFTQSVFDSIQSKGCKKDFVTLHVSAGTFQPVKAANALDHVMHHEQILVKKNTVEALLSNPFTIAVGTTSMRTLESLYWYGSKLLKDPSCEFVITQTDPYQNTDQPSREQALKAVLGYMNSNQFETLMGSSSIYIHPGYSFKICKGLITNFHQPASTLMLLVAAFIGEDWKKIYQEALINNYRFLSYGDSSLLLPN